MPLSDSQSSAWVLVLGLLVSAILGWTVHQLSLETMRADIRSDMKLISARFSQDIRIIQAVSHNVSTSFEADMSAGPEVLQRRFAILTEALLKRYQKIQAVFWAPAVRESDRRSVEQRWQDIDPQFRFYEMSTDNERFPARRRSVHFPVLLVTSELKQQYRAGFDLASDKGIFRGVREATITREPSLSLPVALQGYGQPASADADRVIMLVFPVMLGGSVEGNTEGVMTVLVSVRHLLKEVMDASGFTGFHVTLADRGKDGQGRRSGGGQTEAALLFQHRSLTPPVADLAQTFLIPDIAGHTWALEVAPSEEYVNDLRSNLAYTVTLGCLILTAIITAFVRLSGRRVKELERVSDERFRLLRKSNKELVRKSQTDGLTGVANRSVFEESLDREWKRTLRERQYLGVVLFDIDDFDSFNRQNGRLKGDECLKTIAELVQSSVNRPGDQLARYSGDQFVLLLPNTPESGAKVLAEKCRGLVESIAVAHHTSTGHCVSVSVGYVSLIPSNESNKESLIETVFQALREAKQKGKNQVASVVVAQDDFIE